MMIGTISQASPVDYVQQGRDVFFPLTGARVTGVGTAQQHCSLCRMTYCSHIEIARRAIHGGASKDFGDQGENNGS